MKKLLILLSSVALGAATPVGAVDCCSCDCSKGCVCIDCGGSCCE